jgi:hypothetical protein
MLADEADTDGDELLAILYVCHRNRVVCMEDEEYDKCVSDIGRREQLAEFDYFFAIETNSKYAFKMVWQIKKLITATDMAALCEQLQKFGNPRSL